MNKEKDTSNNVRYCGMIRFETMEEDTVDISGVINTLDMEEEKESEEEAEEHRKNKKPPDGNKHQSTSRTDTEEEEEVKIEYENLTQARHGEGEEEEEEPIKVVKEVIKHTVEQDHQETKNTLEKGEKQDEDLIYSRANNTGETNKDTHNSGKQKETAKSKNIKKIQEAEEEEQDTHKTTEKDDDQNEKETLLEPGKARQTFGTNETTESPLDTEKEKGNSEREDGTYQPDNKASEKHTDTNTEKGNSKTKDDLHLANQANKKTSGKHIKTYTEKDKEVALNEQYPDSLEGSNEIFKNLLLALKPDDRYKLLGLHIQSIMMQINNTESKQEEQKEKAENKQPEIKVTKEEHTQEKETSLKQHEQEEKAKNHTQKQTPEEDFNLILDTHETDFIEEQEPNDEAEPPENKRMREEDNPRSSQYNQKDEIQTASKMDKHDTLKTRITRKINSNKQATLKTTRGEDTEVKTPKPRNEELTSKVTREGEKDQKEEQSRSKIRKIEFGENSRFREGKKEGKENLPQEEFRDKHTGSKVREGKHEGREDLPQARSRDRHTHIRIVEEEYESEEENTAKYNPTKSKAEKQKGEGEKSKHRLSEEWEFRGRSRSRSPIISRNTRAKSCGPVSQPRERKVEFSEQRRYHQEDRQHYTREETHKRTNPDQQGNNFSRDRKENRPRNYTPRSGPGPCRHECLINKPTRDMCERCWDDSKYTKERFRQTRDYYYRSTSIKDEDLIYSIKKGTRDMAFEEPYNTEDSIQLRNNKKQDCHREDRTNGTYDWKIEDVSKEVCSSQSNTQDREGKIHCKIYSRTYIPTLTKKKDNAMRCVCSRTVPVGTLAQQVSHTVQGHSHCQKMEVLCTMCSLQGIESRFLSPGALYRHIQNSHELSLMANHIKPNLEGEEESNVYPNDCDPFLLGFSQLVASYTIHSMVMKGFLNRNFFLPGKETAYIWPNTEYRPRNPDRKPEDDEDQ